MQKHRIINTIVLLLFLAAAFPSSVYAATGKAIPVHQSAVIITDDSKHHPEAETAPSHSVVAWFLSSPKKNFQEYTRNLISQHKRQQFICSTVCRLSLQLPDDYLNFIYPSHHFW